MPWQVSTTDVTDDLYLEMEAAAARLDYEEARRLRDRITLLRAGAKSGTVPNDTRGLSRQQPGDMGLGSSVPTPSKPDGWTRPSKPDPMTRATGRKPPR